MNVKPISVLMALLILCQTGCYNTYNVNVEEFKQIQETDGASFKVIKTEDDQEITITENSRIGVTDKSGRYYPISPFNFTLNTLQLVAPDEDLLLTTREIESTNVKLIDPLNTTILIAGSAAVLIGAAVGIYLLTPECTGDFCSQ